MPKDEPDPLDPMTITGVEFPATKEDIVEMASSMAEEFARSGWDTDRIKWIFQSPFYSGPHRALKQLGKECVFELIEEAVRPWRRTPDA